MENSKINIPIIRKRIFVVLINILAPVSVFLGGYFVVSMGIELIDYLRTMSNRSVVLPYDVPSNVEPEECISNIDCARATFVQMSVTGSKEEPLSTWEVSKWGLQEVKVSTYGFDNINSADRTIASKYLQKMIDLHNDYGLNVRASRSGEKGDVNVFFTADPIADRMEFRNKSGLLLFDSVYVDEPNSPNARCWEQSVSWKFQSNSKKLSAVVIRIDQSDGMVVRMVRCIMEELTHALSPLRRDLSAPADSFFLNSGAGLGEARWLIDFSPLDHLMMRIGHHELIKNGDDLEKTVENFDIIYNKLMRNKFKYNL